jgi:hypothetical protein
VVEINSEKRFQKENIMQSKEYAWSQGWEFEVQIWCCQDGKKQFVIYQDDEKIK